MAARGRASVRCLDRAVAAPAATPGRNAVGAGVATRSAAAWTGSARVSAQHWILPSARGHPPHAVCTVRPMAPRSSPMGRGVTSPWPAAQRSRNTNRVAGAGEPAGIVLPVRRRAASQCSADNAAPIRDRCRNEARGGLSSPARPRLAVPVPVFPVPAHWLHAGARPHCRRRRPPARRRGCRSPHPPAVLARLRSG